MGVTIIVIGICLCRPLRRNDEVDFIKQLIERAILVKECAGH